MAAFMDPPWFTRYEYCVGAVMDQVNLNNSRRN